MKKILIYLFSIIFVFSMLFIGFGCKEEALPKEEAVEKATEEEATEEASKGTIYFLAYEMENTFNIGLAKTIEEYGNELGYEVKVLSCDVKSDVQVQQMETAITTNPVAIVAVPVEPATIADIYDQARDKGILVISADSWVEQTVADMNSVTGVVKLGQIAAEQTVAELVKKYGEEKGKVLQLMGDISSGYTTGIAEGFDEVMSKYENIEVITKDNPQWDSVNAVDTIADQLTANKDYDSIFIHADSRMPLIVPVLEEKGYKKGDIILSGTDGDPTALDMIREGWATFTVAVAMPQLAKGTLFFLEDLLAGKELEEKEYEIDGLKVPLVKEAWGPVLYLPGVLITEDNVDDETLWGNMTY